jgi:hypothetical protein
MKSIILWIIDKKIENFILNQQGLTSKQGNSMVQVVDFSGIHPIFIPDFQVISNDLAIHSKCFIHFFFLKFMLHAPPIIHYLIMLKIVGRSRAVCSILQLLLSCVEISSSAFALRHTQYSFLPQNGRDQVSYTYRRTGER